MNLNESQYQRLKSAYSTYEYYKLSQSLNGQHPGTMHNLNEMESVSQELGRPKTNFSCPTCIVDLMVTMYERSNYKQMAHDEFEAENTKVILVVGEMDKITVYEDGKEPNVIQKTNGKQKGKRRTNG